MKIRKCAVFITLGIISLFLLAAGSLRAAEPQKTSAGTAEKTAVTPLKSDRDYLIGPGDVLEIAVWKDEALTKSPVVRPDGKISFPLIGELMAEGKTISQLKKEIEGSLSRYVPDVDLHVNVQQVNSMIVYVIGKVNNPGRLILNSQVNVLQVLATAGGLNPFAKRGDIKVFRQEGSKTRIIDFDYDDVVEGKHLEQNILLLRGDVVVVP
ncbi:polysaccharide export outer membrane protein [Syntrophus gentianae]|uniref:Polysaccharide export outer membrane protein n=1 Tax=Syntrophus gentianae TaxID=43775 RepID=A0A1H7X464_9BACT|nr:polysaccharide biosynthesis/export family protein [Syntrophus gentianae]SEM27898.1 polysaccharide export outer membrane protein [Syntrophus gentianae]